MPSVSSLAAAFEAIPADLRQGTAGAAVFFVAWTIGSLAVVWAFNSVLRSRARASKNPWDDIVADALRWPVYAWLVLAGLWLLATWFTIVPAAWVPRLQLALELALAFTAAYGVVGVAHGVMDQYAKRRPSFRSLQGVLEFATRLVVYSVALLVVLDHVGVEITPLLGALGIAGLAVALALQETLANFFAGLYVTLDRPLREGDYIELEGGAFGSIKGYVVDVGWRSIRIRELQNNIYVVPNSKVASGIIKNYDLPESEMAVLVQVSVAYDSDLARVERVTIETAREVERKVAGGVPGFDPFIRYHTFGDNGIGFTVILRGATFVDQYLLTHEFIKALHERYRREDIEIPFPQRTLHLAAGNGGPGAPPPGFVARPPTPPPPAASPPRRS